MTLAQMQARFFELKGKLAVGQIQEEEFKQDLERLRFQDGHGRWWMIGAQSGRWYYYDGARWLLGEPPEPPPPALRSGDFVDLSGPNGSNGGAQSVVSSRQTTYSPAQQSASLDAANTAQSISVPYSYSPAQTASARPVPTQPTTAAQAANPPRANGNGGNGYASVGAAAVPTASAPSQAPVHTTFGDTLKQDLGKVHLPHVQMPHIERPNLQAPNIHIPPQFLPHAPGEARKSQPPYILIVAVVVGLALVALLWLAVDNFVPGKPISTFLGFNRNATVRTTKTPRPETVAVGQNVDKLLSAGDDLANKSLYEPAIAQYQAAAKQSPNDADV